jgi:hypothetical protein
MDVRRPPSWGAVCTGNPGVSSLSGAIPCQSQGNGVGSQRGGRSGQCCPWRGLGAGRSGRAQRSAAQRSAAGSIPGRRAQPIAQTRRVQPAPLGSRCRARETGLHTGHPPELECNVQPLRLDPCLGHPGSAPGPCGFPRLGIGGWGEEEDRLAPPPPFGSGSRYSSCCQMNPGMGTCNLPSPPAT